MRAGDRRPRTVCAECGGTYAVRGDGTIRRHREDGSYRACPGSLTDAENNVMCQHCGGRGWVPAPVNEEVS